MTGTPARRLAAALAAAGLLAPGSLPGCAAPGEEAAPAAPPSAAEGSPAAPPSSSAAAGRVVDPRTLVFGETPFAFPKTERAVLSNGMVVHMMRDATLPIVRAAALFRGGTVFDPEGREGLASLASAMVREGGTTNLPIEELEDELDLLAGEVGTGADQEMLTASFSFL